MKKEIITVSEKIEQAYIWTVGKAGNKFFEELRDNARIVGTKCKKCKRVLIPPRIFCEKCFSKLDDWEVVSDEGTVETFSISYIGVDVAKTEEPTYIAVIKLDGSDGGLHHHLGEIGDPKDVKIGMRVKAVFKPQEEREGKITDIMYFKPI